MALLKRSIALILSCAFTLATAVGQVSDDQASQSASQPAQQSSEQLQQLVAPIALYPDALVAQVLAASTYPAQVVEADRWMQQHVTLKGDQLADAVNQQAWDPSVKALTQFPSVLTNMDKNISWTSSLGDAYINQQKDVLNAVQVMRQRAQNAGKLESTPQEKVTTQGSTIVIEPANPSVVYVPAYDPWLVYGAPIAAYPGWCPVPGIFFGGPVLSFGVGFGIFPGFDWGWHSWGFDWRGRTVLYNHNTYVSRSTTFVHRRDFNRGGRAFSRNGFGNRGVTGNHAAAHSFAQPHSGGGFAGGHPAARGFGAPHTSLGTHSSAFSGFGHGGIANSFSSRGHSSFGGGFHGGGRGGRR